MNHLCVYAKAPLAGRCKTRLGAEIGMEAAADLASTLLQDLCEAVSGIPEVDYSLWMAPMDTVKAFRNLVPSHYQWFQQVGEDLGIRLTHTFQTFLDEDPEARIIVVGSDCVTQEKGNIKKALHLLDQFPVILQPTTDGGYALVGMRQSLPQLFQNISWGSSEVMEQSRIRLREMSTDWYELPQTMDIDTVDDLRVLEKKRLNHIPETTAWMQKYAALWKVL